MTKRQRFFFGIGAWACVVTAGIHLLAHVLPQPPPSNDAEATLHRLATTYQKSLGAGFSRTTMDFLKGFSLSFSLFLLWIGILSLLLRRANLEAEWLRRIALVNLIFAAALLLINLAYFFLPPILCVAVILVGFAGAALPAARGGSGAVGGMGRA